MNEIKLCKDCIHLNAESRCTKQIKPLINCVTGEKFDDWHPWRDTPSLQRADGLLLSLLLNTCSKAGRFFEPKQTPKP